MQKKNPFSLFLQLQLLKYTNAVEGEITSTKLRQAITSCTQACYKNTL